MTKTPLSIIALMSLLVGCALDPDADLESSDEEVRDEPVTTGTDEAGLVNPTPVGPGELIAMVKVFTWRGMCSGVVIANDRVLTAGHCFCTENTVGGNVCDHDATVKVRDNPAGGDAPPGIPGTATVHPGYNPSWTDLQIENDLAVIDLNGTVPSYVVPLDVTTTHVPSNTKVLMAGFGMTGSDCNGNAGTLNKQQARIQEYEDSVSLMRFNPMVTCDGDSGGAVLNLAATKIYGIHSNAVWTPSDGWVSKSINAHHYRDWIKGLTCSAAFWDRCDDKGPMCRCGAGLGDCDIDGDCKAGLHCEEDIGDIFGFPESADVCVAAGPPQGTCSCTNSGVGNVCVQAFNGCSAGFSPQCSPSVGSCGGCTCQ